MRFLRRAYSNTAVTGPYPVVVLGDDNWDDYHYKTLFTVTLHLSARESVELTGVKILEKGQTEGRTNVPSVFSRLPGTYCSLGQALSYYETLATLPAEMAS